MRNLIFLFLILLPCKLSAENFTLGDFKNKEFQLHCAAAVALTALTHKTFELFSTHTIRKEWWDEEGYHLKIYRVEDQKWLVAKYTAGIFMVALVSNLTGQEAEPDARAMYIGGVGYTGLCLGFEFIKRGWK